MAHPSEATTWRRPMTGSPLRRCGAGPAPAMVTFWSDAAILSRLGQHVAPSVLLDMMLRIPAKGLTNIACPLHVAARELARVPARDARAVLLSDCEQDADLARELARRGHGRLRRIASYTDVAPALSAIFTR